MSHGIQWSTEQDWCTNNEGTLRAGQEEVRKERQEEREGKTVAHMCF